MFLHIDLVLIESGVFYCSAFFRGGNNDLARAFVLESMGARELIPIPGTCLYIYGNSMNCPTNFGPWKKSNHQELCTV